MGWGRIEGWRGKRGAEKGVGGGVWGGLQGCTCTRLSNSSQKAEEWLVSKLEATACDRKPAAIRLPLYLHDVGVVKLGEGHEPFQLLQPGHGVKVRKR